MPEEKRDRWNDIFPEEFKKLKTIKDWTMHLMNEYPKLFKENNLVTRTVAYLLLEYYEKGRLSILMPYTNFYHLLVAHSEIEENKDNKLGKKVFNAIQLFKKSSLVDISDDNCIKGTYLSMKMRYMDLADTEISLKINAVIEFLKIPKDYTELWDIYCRREGIDGRRDDFRSKIGRVLKPKRNWDDLILSDDIKKEILGFIKTIKNREKLLKWGITYSPKLILGGVVGTGKSLTGEVIAKLLGMQLYIISSEDIVGKYLGDTAMNIAEAFKFTENHSDTCILFIDEIEGLTHKRFSDNSSAGSEITRGINTFLSLLEEKENIIVIGTTNKLEWIDRAVLSRFTKKVFFELPDKAMIHKMLEIHLKEIPLSDDIDLNALSERLLENNISGRDIRNLVIDIAQEMLEFDAEELNKTILELCIDRVLSNRCIEKSMQYGETY